MSEIRLRRAASQQHDSSSSGWREVGLPWWGKPTETPAVFQLERSAKELVHEAFTVDTRDHEDHTFCGVMFDVRCESRMPVDYIEIDTVCVRGHLGPMTVWYTPETFNGKHEAEEAWVKVFERELPPSPEELVELRLDRPIRLDNHGSCGIYVHSGLPGDEGIVYDNQRAEYTYEDRVMKVTPGLAHLSNRPFGRYGLWGRPWRMHREFVGRVRYGVRWLMWKPQVHSLFPEEFKAVAKTMLLASRRPESPVYLLQEEVVLYIMNKCMWDAFGDDSLTRPHRASGLRPRGSMVDSIRAFLRRGPRRAGAAGPTGPPPQLDLQHAGQVLQLMASLNGGGPVQGLSADEGELEDEDEDEDYEEEEEEEEGSSEEGSEEEGSEEEGSSEVGSSEEGSEEEGSGNESEGEEAEVSEDWEARGSEEEGAEDVAANGEDAGSEALGDSACASVPARGVTGDR